MTRTVRITNADWVVAWDPSNGRHAYLEHGDVVFAGNSITFVGRGYAGAADETIDGRGLMVMPGLVNVHAHPGHEASYRGIREEHGVPDSGRRFRTLRKSERRAKKRGAENETSLFHREFSLLVVCRGSVWEACDEQCMSGFAPAHPSKNGEFNLTEANRRLSDHAAPDTPSATSRSAV